MNKKQLEYLDHLHLIHHSIYILYNTLRIYFYKEFETLYLSMLYSVLRA